MKIEDNRGSAREKFVRLAEARTNNVLKSLASLSNLSNRSNYEYSETDVKKIFSVIQKTIRVTQGDFRRNLSGKDEKKEGFRLEA